MLCFLKNKIPAFLIAAIIFTISISNFSNTFAALSGAIFNAPMASAGTTGLEISGYVNSTTTDSLCLRQAGTTSPATTVVSGVYPTSTSTLTGVSLPVTPTVSGTSYEVYKVAGSSSNACVVLAPSTGSVVAFTIFANHTTLLNYSGTAGTFAIRDQLASITSTGGSNVVNFAQGSTNPVTVTLTDADGDNITTAPTLSGNGLVISAPTITGSTVTYTVQPTLAASQTLGTLATVNFTGLTYQYNLGTVNSSIYPTALTSLTFNVANQANPVSLSSITSSSSSIPNYYFNNSNGQTYSCFGGNYQNEIYNNYFYGAIIGAVCNIYWSGYFYPSNGPVSNPSFGTGTIRTGSENLSSSISSMPRASQVFTSSSTPTQAVVIVDSPTSSSSFSSTMISKFNVSSIISNSSNFSASSVCPVGVNSSINYYEGGQISLQNNSALTSKNLSANINLPTGVKVISIEKGYAFYQNGNNLNITFPDVAPNSEVATFYKTNYTGSDYQSSVVINCNLAVETNQSSQPRFYSGYVPLATPASTTSSIIISSSSLRDQGTLGQRSSIVSKPVCTDEIYEKIEACICPLPREFVATSAEADSFRICKLPSTVSSVSVSSNSINQVPAQSVSKISSSSSNPTNVVVTEVVFCNSPNLRLSSDKKFCVCPTAGDLIFINKDPSGKETYICKANKPADSNSISTILVSSTSSSSSAISSTSTKDCESSALILSVDGKECICPNTSEVLTVAIGLNGLETTSCKLSSSNSSNPVSSVSSQSSSSKSDSLSSSVTQAAPATGGSGGVITIGGVGSFSTSSLSQNSSSTVDSVEVLRQSGQLSARNVPTISTVPQNCDDSTKINSLCPATGTLAAREVPTQNPKPFSLEDPYTCGSNLKGSVINNITKTVKYELFKNGSSSPSFVFDVPVKSDGKFELELDYNKVTEDTYKIVLSADNNGTIVTETIEEFITKNCSGVDAIKYYANKTVRTGGQNLIPTALILFGVFTLVGSLKFAFAKPR